MPYLMASSLRLMLGLPWEPGDGVFLGVDMVKVDLWPCWVNELLTSSGAAPKFIQIIIVAVQIGSVSNGQAY